MEIEKIDKRKLNNGKHLLKGKKKKRPVTIYETFEDIDKLGGIDAAREKLKKAFKAAIIIAELS